MLHLQVLEHRPQEPVPEHHLQEPVPEHHLQEPVPEHRPQEPVPERLLQEPELELVPEHRPQEPVHLLLGLVLGCPRLRHLMERQDQDQDQQILEPQDLQEPVQPTDASRTVRGCHHQQARWSEPPCRYHEDPTGT